MLVKNGGGDHQGRLSECIIKGLRPVLEGFVVTMHEGACETGSQIPRALARGVSPRDLTHCSHKPECIVTTDHDRSVLITIITWHFQFFPVNVSILHLKYDYRARSESRFAGYSHCYVMWYPLTTGIVASQCPSARDAVLVTRYLTPFILACFCLWHQWLLEFPINGASDYHWEYGDMRLP